MVRMTDRKNANDKATPKKFSLIYSNYCILTAIPGLFITFQARGECQGDLQTVLNDANILGQEPSDTGHPDTGTAHKYTGSKCAKVVCLQISSCYCLSATLKLSPPKKRRAIL